MRSYLNPGSKSFRESIKSDIYIDKTGLIEQTNSLINTRQKYICISRPRRFGKSMAVDMLGAYYDREEESSDLFDKYNISSCPSYKDHLNKSDVIKVNMQKFLSMRHNVNEMI